jgi:hypothetical protein
LLAKDRSAWIVVRVENGVRPGGSRDGGRWVQYGGLLQPVEP